MEIIPAKEQPAATAPDGLHYRDVVGGLIGLRNEVRSRKAHPEVIVVIDGLSDHQKGTIAALLENPNLEFKISAIDTPNGQDIQLHIRNRVQQTAVGN